MKTPSFRNGYAGSTARWMHTHECKFGQSCTPVEFTPGYMVTSCGQIWGSGKTRGNAFREVKQSVGRAGYLWVQVRVDGKNTKKCVHRVVAMAFHGTPELMQVRHLDGNPHNNAEDNLAWGTAKENAGDRAMHGRTVSGERSPQAKHTDEQVREAVQLVASGVSQREVARKYECSQSSVWRWVHGVQRSVGTTGVHTEAEALVLALEMAS